MTVRRPRFVWALVRAVWLTAGCGFVLGAYQLAMPRFY